MIRAWFITAVMTWRVHMHEYSLRPTPLRRCSRLRLSPTPQHLVTPPWQFTTTHLYPWMASGIEKIKCLVQEHNTIFSWAQAQAYVCTRYYPCRCLVVLVVKNIFCHKFKIQCLSVVVPTRRTLFDVLKDENNFTERFEKRKHRFSSGEKDNFSNRSVPKETTLRELHQENHV